MNDIDLKVHPLWRRTVVHKMFVVLWSVDRRTLVITNHGDRRSETGLRFLRTWSDSYSKAEASMIEANEKREKELEKKRDEDFNSYMPMVPQGKEWRVKAVT
jgi:hypothetical protein